MTSPRNTGRRTTVGMLVVALVAALSLTGAGPVPASAAQPPAGAAALWEASLQGRHGTSPDVTVRQIARASTGGSQIRVRLGNPFGDAPVRVQDAWAGRTIAPGVATLVPGSNRQLRFDGSTTVTIPAGGQVMSDAVAMTVRADEDVAVSLYAPGSPINDHTFPPFPYDPPASYINTGGNTASDESNASFPQYPVIPGGTGPRATATGYHPGQTWWLDLVVADRPAARGTLVTLGDSITDGYQAVGPPGQRWTDILAYRMNRVPAAQRLAVANAGISGNTVSVQPNPYDPTGQCCGPPAPLRLERDVFSVPGVRAVMLLEGTNDLGGGPNAPPAPAQQVIGAMRQIVAAVHARGLPIVGATIVPMCLEAGSPREQARQAVNQWLRTSGTFDAVLDFDAVIRNPANPTEMIPDLRADCYHPNAAGDALLGSFIPLWVFGVPVQGQPEPASRGPVVIGPSGVLAAVR